VLKAIKDNYTYRIVRKIADGGMGSVYEAIQDGTKGFEKIVALKTLLSQLSSNEKFVEMFVEEGKLVADLVHENIVQIYQLGRTSEGYYIVMEFVKGLPLHDFLRSHNLTRSNVPRPLSVFICSRIARGLAYAHSRTDLYGEPMHIVHKDVCPNNVLVTTEGLPKLTDFGIAKASSNLMTADDKSLMGKFTYMAPEQANRESVDFRADIFSLGAVLFELLTGRKVRENEDQDVLLEMAGQGHVEWDFLPDDLDPSVMQILRSCMAVDRDDRYETTQEAARAMEYYIYKDGYGPTIQTLEEYMKGKFPYLYQFQKRGLTNPEKPLNIDIDPTQLTEVATIIMDDD
jgi:serine/threonine protein kinase